MNPKTKKKLAKQLDRQLANKACQFFIYGNPKLKKVFKFRLWQYTNLSNIDIEHDNWNLK